MRARPRQHLRKLQNGNATIVNSGVAPQQIKRPHQVVISGASIIASMADEAQVQLSEELEPLKKPTRLRRFLDSRSWHEAPNGMNFNYQINSKGVGEIIRSDVKTHRKGVAIIRKVTPIGPGHKLNDMSIRYVEMSHVNLEGVRIEGGPQSRVNLTFKIEKSNMDNGSLTTNPEERTIIAGPTPIIALDEVSFRGSSMRNFNFENTIFDDVSLRETDLSGAKFHQCTIERFGKLDVTDSNITAEQINQLLTPEDFQQSLYGFHYSTSSGLEVGLVYRRHTVQEVAEKLGVVPDDLSIDLWAGDIEVRDNETQEVVVGEYDRDKHHIPQWEMQRLIREAGGKN